jgi:hypothetical protein
VSTGRPLAAFEFRWTTVGSSLLTFAPGASGRDRMGARPWSSERRKSPVQNAREMQRNFAPIFPRLDDSGMKCTPEAAADGR